MNLRTIAVFCAVWLVVSPSVSSQQSIPLPDDDSPRIKVDVNVVNVLCAVRDGKGKLVADLEKSDFEIREDGKPQNILYFSRETKLPLTLGLLVDSSVSQQRLIAGEQQAGAAFFEQVLGQQDAAFLISFDVTVDLLQNITGSVNFLRNALGKLHVNSSGGGPGPTSGPFPSIQTGGTHLYDAVYLAAREVLQSEVGRKAIVLITDGQDQGSKVKREQAIEAAHRSDVIVYGILFVDREFYGYGGFGYSGDSALGDMAKETGGRVFNAGSDRELREAFDQISSELRSQYSLGYSPSNTARDGTFRRLEVKAAGRGLRVQTRRGYYAPKG